MVRHNTNQTHEPKLSLSLLTIVNYIVINLWIIKCCPSGLATTVYASWPTIIVDMSPLLDNLGGMLGLLCGLLGGG